MTPQVSKQAFNIVLRGSFNPAIFHPSWFKANNLIGPSEAEGVNFEKGFIIHPDAAVFEIAWFRIQVDKDRFLAATSQESYTEPLRDLVMGILILLSHTPLRAMGLNCDFHYQFASLDLLNALGYRLAPKADWEPLLNSPGMRTLTMEGERPDKLAGYLLVKVEPSALVIPGLYVNVNDHYNLAMDGKPSITTDAAVEILQNKWNDSITRSRNIATGLAKLGD